jgi:hypothetical protein
VRHGTGGPAKKPCPLGATRVHSGLVREFRSVVLLGALLAVGACSFPSRGTPSDGPADASLAVVDAAVADRDAAAGAPDAMVVRPNVLVLSDAEGAGDPDPLPPLRTALEARAIDVSDGGFYGDWSPPPAAALAAYDVVIWLQGTTYDADVENDLAPALRTYVDGGGVLVRTEWSVYNADGFSDYDGIDDVLPVTSLGGDFGYGATWSAAEAHPYLLDVALPFTTGAGYSEVEVSDQGTVLATLAPAAGGPSMPALTYREFGGGRVVHLNHDVLYTLNELSPQLLLMLGNIAWASVPP